jgi:hypothetical protein
MFKQYLIEAAFWLVTVVGPVVLVWIGRWIGKRLERWGDAAVSAMNGGIDHLIELSKSALVDKGLEQLRDLAGPIVRQAFVTASKEIISDLQDGKIDQAEAEASLKKIGGQVRADIKVATAEWKRRMEPYIGDTDKLVDAVTEELYEVIKRNFRERNCAPAPRPAVPVSTSASATGPR